MSRQNVLLFSATLFLASSWVLIQYASCNRNQANEAADSVTLNKTISESRAVVRSFEGLDIDSLLEDWHSKLSHPAALEHRDSHRMNMDIPLASRYENLVNKSMSGNPDAATDLAVSLSYCAAVPRDDEQQERLINYTNQTRRVEGYVYPVDDLDGAIQEIVRRYEFCKGVTRDQILDLYLYEKIAAENGSLQAKVSSVNYGWGMYYGDVSSALERAWSGKEEMWEHNVRHTADAARAGNVNAIYRLGRIFEFGDRTFGDIRLNTVEAAAYRVAGAHLKMLSGSSRQLYQPAMEKAINSLSAHDATAAIALANQIIEREDCCFVYRSHR